MFNILTVTLHRDVIDRERTSGIYRLSAFYCSVMASEILLVCIRPLIFYPLIYWVAGLAVHPIAFFSSVAIFVLFVIATQVFPLFVIATTVFLSFFCHSNKGIFSHQMQYLCLCSNYGKARLPYICV